MYTSADELIRLAKLLKMAARTALLLKTVLENEEVLRLAEAVQLIEDAAEEMEDIGLEVDRRSLS